MTTALQRQFSHVAVWVSDDQAARWHDWIGRDRQVQAVERIHLLGERVRARILRMMRQASAWGAAAKEGDNVAHLSHRRVDDGSDPQQANQDQQALDDGQAARLGGRGQRIVALTESAHQAQTVAQR